MTEPYGAAPPPPPPPPPDPPQPPPPPPVDPNVIAGGPAGQPGLAPDQTPYIFPGPLPADLGAQAYQPPNQPTQYDIGWFTDAGQLGDPTGQGYQAPAPPAGDQYAIAYAPAGAQSPSGAQSAADGQGSVIDSKLVPGEVYWIDSSHDKGAPGDHWAEGFPTIAPEVQVQQTPGAPNQWTITVDGVVVARVATPDGGAPAIGMMRDFDRLQVIANLPPGATFTETSAPVNQYIDFQPFAHRDTGTQPEAAAPGGSPQQGAVGAHPDAVPGYPAPVAPGDHARPGSGADGATRIPPDAAATQPGPAYQPPPPPGPYVPPVPPDIPQAPYVPPLPPGPPVTYVPPAPPPGPWPGAQDFGWGGGKHAPRERIHPRLAKDPPVDDAKPGDQAQPAGQKQDRPPHGALGTLIHELLLDVLSARLAAIRVLHGVELKAPGGSKNVESEHHGRVDLTLFRPDHKKPGRHIGHLYDLKPDDPKKTRYQDYVSEVHHYTEYFPANIPGGKVSPPQPAPVLVSGAEIGTDLSIYARVVPQLLDEVRISDDALEVTFRLSLPVDKKGRPIKGLVVYTWTIRQKRPGEDDSVQRAVEWMKTRAYQTHDAQIRMELQLGAAERIAFHVAFATGFAGPWVLVAATESAPEVAAGLGATAADIGAGGTAAGTGAGGATVIRLAPAVVESITKAAAAVMLSLHGAAPGPSHR